MTERARKRKAERLRRKRVDQTRVCEVCGGPITDRNKTGICAKNHACRVAAQERRNAGKPHRRPLEGSSYLLPAVFDVSTPAEYDEDGNLVWEAYEGTGQEIVDEVAIQIAFEGRRRVGLTATERLIVIEKMIKVHAHFREIADHLGTSPAKVRPLIESLGYEVISRRTSDAHRSDATEIRRVRALS